MSNFLSGGHCGLLKTHFVTLIYDLISRALVVCCHELIAMGSDDAHLSAFALCAEQVPRTAETLFCLSELFTLAIPSRERTFPHISQRRLLAGQGKNKCHVTSFCVFLFFFFSVPACDACALRRGQPGFLFIFLFVVFVGAFQAIYC